MKTNGVCSILTDEPEGSGDRLLHLTDRQEWRAWLAKNYRVASEVWLVYYRTHTGKPRISYNDAVEEALSFGWIDGKVRSIDGEKYAQRFSPRRPGSRYSQANLERLRFLVAEGKVAEDVLGSLPDLSEEAFEIPSDIVEAVKANPEAWAHFQRFSPSYVRIRVAFIDGARDRPEEFKKRLAHFVRMTEQNKQYGFGGIKKYF
jgi:uncharacterized protein YdeI (YjbR/CyaY-like superfamily)